MTIGYVRRTLALVHDEANALSCDADLVENISGFAFVLNVIVREFSAKARHELLFELQSLGLRRGSFLQLPEPLIEPANFGVLALK